MWKFLNELFFPKEEEVVSKFYIKKNIKYHYLINKYVETYTVMRDSTIGVDEIIDDGLLSLQDAKDTLNKYLEIKNTTGEKIVKDV